MLSEKRFNSIHRWPKIRFSQSAFENPCLKVIRWGCCKQCKSLLIRKSNKTNDRVEKFYSLFYFTCDSTKLFLLPLQQRETGDTAVSSIDRNCLMLSRLTWNNRQYYQCWMMSEMVIYEWETRKDSVSWVFNMIIQRNICMRKISDEGQTRE